MGVVFLLLLLLFLVFFFGGGGGANEIKLTKKERNSALWFLWWDC